MLQANCVDSNKDFSYLLSEYTYCIESFYEEAGREAYTAALNFAAANGFNIFLDIGCATGVQAELFRRSPVTYVGIEACPGLMWRPLEVQYIKERYPCELPADLMCRKVLGASRLCVGYLMTDYEAIAKQFDDFLLNGSSEARHALSKLYQQTYAVHVDGDKYDGWNWYHGSRLR